MSVNVDHTTPTYCLITDATSISLHDADTSLGHDETPQGEEILIFKFYSEARKRGVFDLWEKQHLWKNYPATTQITA